MDASSSTLLIAAVIGMVQVVKHTFGDNRVSGFLTIASAIAVGALAGYYHVQSLPNVAYGILIALGAIGVSTIADRINS